MRWWIILGGWSAFGFLLAGQRILQHLSSEGGSIKWNVVLLTLGGVYTWAALTPLIFWLSRSYPMGRQNWRRSLTAHLVAMVVVGALDGAVFLAMDDLIFHSLKLKLGAPFHTRLLELLTWTGGFSVFYYVGMVALWHAFDYHGQARARELTASQLETRLAQAQLQMLRMQLQPHFLFNTLHAISALLEEDPKSAERMLARLSDLLRLTLNHQGRQEIPLLEELEHLKAYLDIQQIRFNDRLNIRQHIAEDALDAAVPSSILQPLVENAIRHGIQARPAAGLIEIAAHRRGGYLELSVRDDGIGLRKSPEAVSTGIGLGNTRARLQQLHGSDHVFEIADAEGGGVRVRIVIPYRTVASRRAVTEPEEARA